MFKFFGMGKKKEIGDTAKPTRISTTTPKDKTPKGEVRPIEIELTTIEEPKRDNTQYLSQVLVSVENFCNSGNRRSHEVESFVRSFDANITVSISQNSGSTRQGSVTLYLGGANAFRPNLIINF